jgi:tetratricopeptide (TPR) repeat protein
MKSYEADLDRFELLKRRQGIAPFHHPGSLSSREVERVLDRHDLPRRVLVADPGDIAARSLLAARLQTAGYFDAALEEFDDVLEMNPDYLPARYSRAVLLRELQRDEAEREFSSLVEHPYLEALLREAPLTIRIFHHNSSDHLLHGRLQEAERVAKQGLANAVRLKKLRAESHYALARVYAVGAINRPDWFPPAVDHLQAAYQEFPKATRIWLDRDPLLDTQRADLVAALPHYRRGGAKPRVETLYATPVRADPTRSP